VAAACSTVQPEAARVGDQVITVRDFEDQLGQIRDDPLFLPQQPITDAGSGQLSNPFVRQLLFVKTLAAYATERNAERGVTPPTDDSFQQQVRSQTASVMGFDPGSGQWATVDEATRGPVEADVAQILALIDSYRRDADDPAAVRAFYDANPGRFGLLCARHILVDSEAAADTVRERLDAGEDFAAVAAEVSTDPGSKDAGGLLYTEGQDCPPASGLVPEFVDGALAATPGQPSDPVQTQFGWHVILVDEQNGRPCDEVAPEVADIMRREAGQLAVADFGRSDVWINPRFGTWDADTGFIDAPTTGPAS
jgi:parvulin-like peptidyl-prolyl isomerase